MKTKHLVPLYFVGVHRDITTTVQVQVPEHEIAILQEMHGRDNVYQRERTGTDTALDPATEFARLSRKYGEEAVLEAYGAPAIAQREIPRVVEANSTGTVEDEGKAIVLEGPDSTAPLLSLPASEVQRPEATAKARRQAVAA